LASEIGSSNGAAQKPPKNRPDRPGLTELKHALVRLSSTSLAQPQETGNWEKYNEIFNEIHPKSEKIREINFVCFCLF
jgi:hypothetical protein